METLRQRGIELKLNARVTKMEKNRLVYQEKNMMPSSSSSSSSSVGMEQEEIGVELRFGLCVWAAGTAPRKITQVRCRLFSPHFTIQNNRVMWWCDSDHGNQTNTSPYWFIPLFKYDKQISHFHKISHLLVGSPLNTSSPSSLCSLAFLLSCSLPLFCCSIAGFSRTYRLHTIPIRR